MLILIGSPSSSFGKLRKVELIAVNGSLSIFQRRPETIKCQLEHGERTEQFIYYLWYI